MITSLSLSILATRNAGLGTTVLEATPAGSAPVKGAPAQVPGPPMNVTPSGGKTLPLPMPAPTNQQNVPAPAAPAKK